MSSTLDGRGVTAGLALATCIALATGAAHASTAGPFDWQPGHLVTYSQESRAMLPGSARLASGYNTVYASTSGVFEVGLPGAAGHSMIFTSASAVFAYLPETGPAGPLPADLLNPTGSHGGQFAADVTALQFTVDFSDAGELGGSLGIALAALILRRHAPTRR